MVCPPAVHLNPANYEDPLDFNPWRWEVGTVRVRTDHPFDNVLTMLYLF